MDERRMNQDGAVAGVNGDEFQPYECFQAAGGGEAFLGTCGRCCQIFCLSLPRAVLTNMFCLFVYVPKESGYQFSRNSALHTQRLEQYSRQAFVYSSSRPNKCNEMHAHGGYCHNKTVLTKTNSTLVYRQLPCLVCREPAV